MSKPGGAMAIGDSLYLFYAPIPSNECIISAHGGHTREKHFDVPLGITLNFYTWHGWSLKDPGMTLMAVKPTPKESIAGPAKTHDYLLSKYQGRHSGGSETYDSISKSVREEAMSYLSWGKKVKSAKTEAGRKGALSQQAMYHPFNVVTIRNRWFKDTLKLSEVIRQVRAVVPMITVFHCSFCRSSLHVETNMSGGAY